jgi:hypothetical protein
MKTHRETGHSDGRGDMPVRSVSWGPNARTVTGHVLFKPRQHATHSNPTNHGGMSDH